MKQNHSPFTVVSYKNMVTGEFMKKMQEDEIEEGDEQYDGLWVEERKVGDYKCP